MAITPKGCWARYVQLDGRGKAEVRIQCSDNTPYYSQHVKARSVSFRGAHVGGAARVDFVLSPAHAVCRKSSGGITCSLVGDTSQASLRGARRRRRRR